MGSNAIAFFAGAELATRSADTEYPFRQDSDFWYLTGFDHPGATAVLRTDDGPAFTLFVEPRDPSAEVWTGYRPGVEGAIEDYGATLEALRGHGLEVLETGPERGQLWVADPDGNVIELIAPPAPA